ncbi:hypothetical protein PARMER_02056 [Parabacteroides merdae ATCC 43184]|nr:hypothetical protein PARMER_02056 [Parabacteroides merdae ATCC 43184]DAQ74070.1 MAG TPA: hypothetical protein [Caudoviricetes sp.]DAZ25175.1 MAG TPA: hypothetical protein [Caudoviricetes sp.]
MQKYLIFPYLYKKCDKNIQKVYLLTYITQIDLVVN